MCSYVNTKLNNTKDCVTCEHLNRQPPRRALWAWVCGHPNGVVDTIACHTMVSYTPPAPMQQRFSVGKRFYLVTARRLHHGREAA
jgi:hypothetical protein